MKVFIVEKDNLLTGPARVAEDVGVADSLARAKAMADAHGATTDVASADVNAVVADTDEASAEMRAGYYRGNYWIWLQKVDRPGRQARDGVRALDVAKALVKVVRRLGWQRVELIQQKGRVRGLCVDDLGDPWHWKTDLGTGAVTLVPGRPDPADTPAPIVVTPIPPV